MARHKKISSGEIRPKIERWVIFESADGKKIRFPIYRIGPAENGGIPEALCARYAREVAAQLFGRRYEPHHAWDFRYNYETTPVRGFRHLREMHRRGRLLQGYLVGFYNPNSSYLSQRDRNGSVVAYTHVAAFLGEDTDNRLRFGHLVIRDRAADPDTEMQKRRMKPIEIITDIRRKRTFASL